MVCCFLGLKIGRIRPIGRIGLMKSSERKNPQKIK